MKSFSNSIRAWSVTIGLTQCIDPMPKSTVDPVWPPGAMLLLGDASHGGLERFVFEGAGELCKDVNALRSCNGELGKRLKSCRPTKVKGG